MKIDHHLHTARHSPDSVIDPYALLDHARRIGLDGLVITEHDHQWDTDELKELSARAPGLTVLSGVEVSALEGHFLVYGLPDLRDVSEGIPLMELLSVAQHHGAAVIAAHPFRWGQPFDAIMSEVGLALDGLEYASNNITLATQRKTREVLRKYPQLGITGSSDGHVLEAIGCYYSLFPQPITTMSEFVAALKAKTARPQYRPGAWAACGKLEAGPYE